VSSASADRREQGNTIAVRQADRAIVNKPPVDDHQVDRLRFDAQSPQQIGEGRVVAELEGERFPCAHAGMVIGERRVETDLNPHFSSSALPDSDLLEPEAGSSVLRFGAAELELGAKYHLYSSCMSSGNNPTRSPSETEELGAA
jgi:hypothetical protein